MDVKWIWLFIDAVEPARPVWEFWRRVCWGELSPTRGERDQFATILAPQGEPWVKLQAVNTGGGVHLDIDVEDVDAAAGRATALGASEIHRYPEGTVIVMRSPGGFVFCLTRWHGEARQVRTGVPELADQICLDIPPDAFAAEASFWSSLLGIPRAEGSRPEYAVLPRPDALPVRVLLQRLQGGDGPVTGHVDFSCVDRRGAVERHLALGAQVVREFPYWTVLADPAGHYYCLTDRDPDLDAARRVSNPARWRLALASAARQLLLESGDLTDREPAGEVPADVCRAAPLDEPAPVQQRRRAVVGDRSRAPGQDRTGRGMPSDRGTQRLRLAVAADDGDLDRPGQRRLSHGQRPAREAGTGLRQCAIGYDQLVRVVSQDSSSGQGAECQQAAGQCGQPAGFGVVAAGGGPQVEAFAVGRRLPPDDRVVVRCAAEERRGNVGQLERVCEPSAVAVGLVELGQALDQVAVVVG